LGRRYAAGESKVAREARFCRWHICKSVRVKEVRGEEERERGRGEYTGVEVGTSSLLRKNCRPKMATKKYV